MGYIHIQIRHSRFQGPKCFLTLVSDTDISLLDNGQDEDSLRLSIKAVMAV